MALAAFMRYTGKTNLGGVVAFNEPLLLTKENILTRYKSVQQKTPLLIYASLTDKIMDPAKLKNSIEYFKTIYSTNFAKYVTVNYKEK